MSWRALWGVLCLLATLLLVGVVWVGGTVAGTRYSIDLLQRLLPALSIDLDGGTWAGGLRVRSLRYDAPAVVVYITDLALELRPATLLWGEVDIRSATAGSVVLRLVDSGAPRSEAGLPTVLMPVTLRVANLKVPYFELITVGGTSLVASVETALRWRGTAIRASDAVLRWRDTRIETELGIDLHGDYAVDTRLKASDPRWPGPLEAVLSGSLVSLKAKGSLDGALPVAFSVKAGLLQEGLPLAAFARAYAPATFSVAGRDLTLLAGEALLGGEWRDLEGSISGRLADAAYGDTQFTLPFAWSGGTLRLTAADWRTDHGAVETSCELTPDAGSWHCSGALQGLSLQPWTDAARAELNAPFEIAGRWSEAGQRVEVDLPKLGGHVQGQALSGRLALASDDWKLWTLGSAGLNFGSSRVQLRGSLGATFDLQADLSSADIGQLVDGGGGALSAKLVLRGPASALDVSGILAGDKLRLADYRSRKLSASLDLKRMGAGSSRLNVRLSGLRRAGKHIGRLALVAEGTLARHELRARLVGSEQHRLRLACGGERSGRWRLSCERFDGHWPVGGAVRSWQLDHPARLTWQARDHRLMVEPFCVLMQPASLCVTESVRLEAGKLRPVQVKLRRLPLVWWAGALPEAVVLDPGSYLEAELVLESADPLSARLVARIGVLRWHWSSGEGTFPARLDGIELVAELGAASARLTGSARSAALGGLSLRLDVADPAGEKRLDGVLAIDNLRLEAFRWVSGSIQQLAGQIDGEVLIGGTAKAPRLGGRLQLAGGVFKDASLPYPLSRVRATMDFDDGGADILGSFLLGDGSARLTGRLDLLDGEPAWRLNANLDTDTLSLPLLEDSRATGSAHLRMKIQPGSLALRGDVRLDSADIRLRSLPPNTIGLSPDAEIVGLRDQPAGWQVTTDIGVYLGDALRLRGFGADLTLAGQVRFRNSQRYYRHLTGEVRVVSGRYRAYGQELIIRKGQVVFSGPVENPDVRLEAIRESRDRETVAGLRVFGTLQNPSGELFSEPPMSETEVAYFLLTGRQRPESGGTDASAEGTLLNLGLAQTNEATARFAERFGIRDFHISAGSTEQGLETRLSGYIAPNLFVSYGTVLQENTNTLTVQYYITPKIMIEAVSGFTSALDIIYSFSIR